MKTLIVLSRSLGTGRLEIKILTLKLPISTIKYSAYAYEI